jgi:hypothetical protein
LAKASVLLVLLAAPNEVTGVYGTDWLTSIPWPEIVLLTTLTKTIIAIPCNLI